MLNISIHMCVGMFKSYVICAAAQNESKPAQT